MSLMLPFRLAAAKTNQEPDYELRKQTWPSAGYALFGNGRSAGTGKHNGPGVFF